MLEGEHFFIWNPDQEHKSEYCLHIEWHLYYSNKWKQVELEKQGSSFRELWYSSVRAVHVGSASEQAME